MVKSKVLRVLLIIVGFISFGLGTVGIVVPGVLPTVPFYLLTSYCFAKSSKRFNNWFLNSKFYKKYLENFAMTRAMIFRNELCLLLGVSTILMVTIYFVNNLVVTCILTSLIFLKYLYFVLRVDPISKDEYNAMQIERQKLKKEELAKKVIMEQENKQEDIKQEDIEKEGDNNAR